MGTAPGPLCHLSPLPVPLGLGLCLRGPGSLPASYLGLSLQDTVLGACPLEASQPTFLPRIPTGGAGELELVARELQALHEELRGAAEPRRAAWEARVRAWGADVGCVYTAPWGAHLESKAGRASAAARQGA